MHARNKNINSNSAAKSKISPNIVKDLGMDAIDRKILGVLQQDASLSGAEVGNRVGLSSTPCWKRIQKLEAEGVIQKRVAAVDPDKGGLGVSGFVPIGTGHHSEEWLLRL